MTLSLITALLVFGGVGTVASLSAAGVIDLSSLPRQFGWGSDAEPSMPEGWVAVPISAKPIPAFAKVKREHLFDTSTGRFAYAYVPPEQVQEEMLTSMSEITGRVLDHEKPAGYAFTEKDFLPEGTRPGVTAGVPPGKRAYRLEVNRVSGVHELVAGDHIDLIASVPLEVTRRGSQSLLTSAGHSAMPAEQAEIRVVVEDAVVVTPVMQRVMTTTTNSLTQGRRAIAVPVEEMVIAIKPGEVPRLSESVALEYTLIAVAHSGHPDDDGTSSISMETDSRSLTRTIETIVGDKRQVLVFPPSSSSPVSLD